ncbi:kinesin-like protein KIF13A isoform X2 [Hyalella azteca]|uniref:Kinesin-like protein KIF13A isoform X2 n=1 Tax=Hyalella azteca TaxID=294128 RepID=A0A979FUW5_HYAAZ|nr:kinesin-like protein KIF13A isoform X2 [Hyalella azteca]
MMGTDDNKGLIPRLCDELFERIARTDHNTGCKVEVSYMELYNEKLNDLLDPSRDNRQQLKIREFSKGGIVVNGLSALAVTSYAEIERLIMEGNAARTVAATNMNAESSRSHAVFNVVLTQTVLDVASGVSGAKVSKLSLVDLAGSERASKTGAVGERLREGSNINKSLSTLGLVISKLAEQDSFVPYRDSQLTMLLKDNLGGNSKTVMVATISPSSDNYEETLSTLRYANQAKRIVNNAVVNEDQNAKLIRELREEVDSLKGQLQTLQKLHKDGSASIQEASLNAKLHESEKLITNLSQTWEDKLKATERVQQERQQALEKMGISVQTSGISVEKDKYYLVNLNADPSLNEMLVYYLKDQSSVGRPGVAGNDIQLGGVGISARHCVFTIEDNELFLDPMPDAKNCVNGVQIVEKTKLRNGDRVVWGFNYYFRVNCPRSTGVMSEPQTPAQAIDYHFAREELMLHELSNDPIQAAIQSLERQHEEDKQMALEKQRQEYERQFQQLRSIMSPTTPYAPYALPPHAPYAPSAYDLVRSNKMTPSTPTSQHRIDRWAHERENIFRHSLARLRQDIMTANNLVQQANFLANELKKNTKFEVTLQIPPENLSPNRKKSSFVSEPAIRVKRRGKPSQVWSLEKLEHKLILMRELHEDAQNCNNAPNINNNNNNDTRSLKNDNTKLGSPEPEPDPFYDSQETHNLVGVANIFLECLFSDVRLSYHVPIISQQAEVAGRLQVEISRVAGHFPAERIADTQSDTSSNDADADESCSAADVDNAVTIRVSIRQASGLPPSLSNFVFCQYQMFGQQEPQVVAPIVDQEYPAMPSKQGESLTFKFDHTKDYRIPVTEDFLELCVDGALSFEVWGHRSAGFAVTQPGWELDHQLAKARSLADRWSELTRKVELWVEVQELGDGGSYESVEVVPQKDVLTGGVYQLRQGQQRRIVCKVKPVPNSGTLPIICQSITSISIGSVSVRLKIQRQLDSYSEEDLKVLKENWNKALLRRRTYLQQQLQKVMSKCGVEQSSLEQEREQSLVEQWVSLTEEQNAVHLPPPGSNIPGAPADWTPPIGKEAHIPVIFLNLNGEDFSSQNNGEFPAMAGTNAIIPKEISNKFFPLPIVDQYSDEVCTVASWDSSIHNNPLLNRVTAADERVYLIVKCVVRLSHPVTMDVLLRKRICVNIYKKQSLTTKFMRSLIGSGNSFFETAVIYEIVSNIPKASEELEERESLAQMAANEHDSNTDDGDTYIEKYTKGVTSVESILLLDRLRQSVAVKELLQSAGRPLMRKTASVPNFSNLQKRLRTNLELFGSVEGDLNISGAMPRSGSFMDMNGAALQSNNNSNNNGANTPCDKPKHRYSLPSPSERPYGLSRPTFLNLSLNLNSLRHQGTGSAKSSPSPGPVKMAPRMTTVLEECHPRPLMQHPEEDEDDGGSGDVDSEVVSRGAAAARSLHRSRLSHSRTLDSLQDVSLTAPSAKSGTPSTLSSGYGSGAVSSSTLSDDSLSVRSSPDLATSPAALNSSTAANSDGLSIYSSGESDSSDTKTVVQTDSTSLLNIAEPSCDFSAVQSSPRHLVAVVTASHPLAPEATASSHPLASNATAASHPLVDESKNKSDPAPVGLASNEDIIPSSMLLSATARVDERSSDSSHVEEMENSCHDICDDNHNTDVRGNDSLTSSGYSDGSGLNVPEKACSALSLMHASAPPGLDVFSGSLESHGLTSSETSLNDGNVIPTSESMDETEFLSLTRSSTCLSSASSSSSLSNYSTSTTSRSSGQSSSSAVVHRKKSLSKNNGKNSLHRMSFPLAQQSKTSYENGEDGRDASGLPHWCRVGESVRIRPYDYTGVIAFLGMTHFSKGAVTAGIILDCPMGKNDGSVEGERYFKCAPKFGLFVRPDKLHIDRKGRAMRSALDGGGLKSSTDSVTSPPASLGAPSSMRRSKSTAEKLSDSSLKRLSIKNDAASLMRRSASRSEELSAAAPTRHQRSLSRRRK